MKKARELLAEYDFSTGVRGKYAKRYAKGTNLVPLRPEILARFPNAASVNMALDALRAAQEAEAKKADSEEIAARVRLANVIMKLSEKQREVIYLRYYEGLTNQRIASRLGLIPATVSDLHSQAMTKLRSSVGPRSLRPKRKGKQQLGIEGIYNDLLVA